MKRTELQRYTTLRPGQLKARTDREFKHKKVRGKALWLRVQEEETKKVPDWQSRRDEIDALCSQICRLKMPVCCECDNPAVHCHHIVKRGWVHRWDPRNHRALCEDHHNYYHTEEGLREDKELADSLGLNRQDQGKRPHLLKMDVIAERLRAELRALKAAA